MAKAENMLQTGHAGRLMWIKFRQMIHAVFFAGRPLRRCNATKRGAALQGTIRRICDAYYE